MGRVRRATAVLAATVIVGAVGASSAGAHINRNVGHVAGHMKKHFFTKKQSDARYFTQALANSRFALADHDHDGAYFTKEQADGRFAPAGHDHDGAYFTKEQADGRFAPAGHDHDGLYLTQQEALAMFAPAPPPTPYDPPSGGAFTLEIDDIPGQMTLNSVAGCFPKAIGALPELCHLSVRGIPVPLVGWLAATADSHPQAVQDISIRAVAAAVERQLQVRNAFITRATVDLDGASSDTGSVDLVVVPGATHLVTPTAGGAPALRSFTRSHFSMQVPGIDTGFVTKVEGVGISVPPVPQSDGQHAPGEPEGHVFTVATSAATTAGAVNARQQWEDWGDDIADGGRDPRSGSVRILAGDLSTILAEFGLELMVPLTQLSPFKVGSGYTMELGRHQVSFST